MAKGKDEKKIEDMNIIELVDVILANPEFLSDSYYSELGNAIESRYATLRVKMKEVFK